MMFPKSLMSNCRLIIEKLKSPSTLISDASSEIQQQPHHIDLHRNAKLGAAPLKAQRRQDVEHHAGDKPSDHALHRLVAG